MEHPQFSSRSIYENGEPAVSRRQKTAFKPDTSSLIRIIGTRLKQWLYPAWRLIRRQRADGTYRLSFRKLLGSLAGIGLISFLILWITLPNIDDPKTLFAAQSTIIVDRNGVELYRLFSEQDRTYVPKENISEFIKQATISIEDERFFDRGCFDAIGFTRALMSQLFPGIFVRSGGSTLTQQFAGNALVGRNRSVIRKARELLLACKLERRYDKPELLELYLNWIPYGENAYGVEQASRRYFGKSAKDLSLAQSTVLAALPQRPSYLNPYGPNARTRVSDQAVQKINAGAITSLDQIPERDIRIGLLGQYAGSGSTRLYIGGRTDQVLQNMRNQNMITDAQKSDALKELETMAFKPARDAIRAPHFVLWIKNQVETMYGLDDKVLTQGGFTITTTLDWNLQQLADKAVTKHKEDVLTRFGAHNTALLSVHPQTKEILAYVGNTDYQDEEHEGKIDMVRSPRQPGSSFKPFVYAAAFEEGFSPGTPIYDVQTKFGENTPQNFGGDFWGLMTMRSALAGSRNIPAIKAFFLAGGEEKVLALAKRAGVGTPSVRREQYRKENPDYEYGYPLAIGSAESPLSEMVAGYATFANEGQYQPLKSILKITTVDGNVVPLPKVPDAEEAMDARIAAMITSMLSDVDARPNEYWKSVLSVPGYQTAAKTGTSNKCLQTDKEKNCTLRHPESTWTVGYTPGLVTGVWVGNATSASLYDRADGLTTAAPIWKEYMTAAHKILKDVKADFPLPDRINQPLISRLSGKLASECTPVDLRKSDLFLAENTPTEEDTACVLVEVDKVTKLLASPSCPSDAVEKLPFFVPSSEDPKRWTSWEQAVHEWARKEMDKLKALRLIDPANLSGSGTQLPLPLPPTELCDASLTPGRLDQPEITILSPRSTATYPAFDADLQIDSRSRIRSVKFELDGKKVSERTQSPFDGPVRIPRSINKSGSHTFRVTITDEYFNTATDEVSLSFEDDSSGPSVQIMEPREGTALTKGSTVTIKADASDNSGIERVQFFLDNKLLTTRRDAPYELTYKLDLPAGTYTLRAVAKDNAEFEGSDEVMITVTE